MFERIIALRGKGGSGKTTTIRGLRSFLTSIGFRSIGTLFNGATHDFADILTDGIRTVGITSCGDTYDVLNNMLGKLDEDNVPIAICACRTKEMNIGRGTNGILSEYSNDIVFVDKTIDTSRSYEDLNRLDIERLFQALENWWRDRELRA